MRRLMLVIFLLAGSATLEASPLLLSSRGFADPVSFGDRLKSNRPPWWTLKSRGISHQGLLQKILPERFLSRLSERRSLGMTPQKAFEQAFLRSA